MKRVFISTFLVLVLVILTACGSANSTPTTTPTISGELKSLEGDTLASQLQRLSFPEVNISDQTTLVDDNNAFAFDLYQSLKESGSNLFYSPFSVSMALAMTFAGARGETEQQMADTLHFILEHERLHPAFNWLDSELAKRGKEAEGKDGEVFRLNVTNAIWGQKDYQFLVDFLDILAENYGAGLRGLDFINEPEQSRITINQWVSEQTEGRIKDLIPPGSINAWTRLVLTNAIYFNAAWQHQFSDDMTTDSPFYLLEGGQVTVPMMRQTELFGYAEGNGYQVVELPYDGGELSMVIILPDEGKFEDLEVSLDAQLIDDIIKNIEYKNVNLAMPKFEFESEFSLKDILAIMGMPIAFSDSADFSGMTGTMELFIADIIHKAFVSVDENGTEAAAATAVIMAGSAPIEPVRVNIDRPFIFLIRDIPTDTILFIGRVLNPTT
jgi:serpin B